MTKKLQVGTKVRVPWGLEDDVEGQILEVWGDPPSQVRVQLSLGDRDEEPVILLLSTSVVQAA